MKGLNFRSESSMMVVFTLILTVAVIIWLVGPKDQLSQNMIGGGLIGTMVVLIVFMHLNARLRGQPYPHCVDTIRLWQSGVPIQRDFFFASSDPMRSILDVVPLMKIDPATKRPLPYRIGGRLWWPYKARDAFGVDIPGYGKQFEFVRVLPQPWESFFGHHYRENGAYIYGEVIDKGDSDCITSYLSPYAYKYLDRYLPVLLGVEGTSTYRKITKRWAPTMQALAKIDMQKVISERPEEIWPRKNLDEIAAGGVKDEELKKKVLEAMAK